MCHTILLCAKVARNYQPIHNLPPCSFVAFANASERLFHAEINNGAIGSSHKETRLFCMIDISRDHE